MFWISEFHRVFGFQKKGNDISIKTYTVIFKTIQAKILSKKAILNPILILHAC